MQPKKEEAFSESDEYFLNVSKIALISASFNISNFCQRGSLKNDLAKMEGSLNQLICAAYQRNAKYVEKNLFKNPIQLRSEEQPTFRLRAF